MFSLESENYSEQFVIDLRGRGKNALYCPSLISIRAEMYRGIAFRVTDSMTGEGYLNITGII